MEVIEVIDTPIEVIQITEREVEVIEMIERGPAGPTGATGPQGPAGAGGVTSVTGTAPIVSSGGTTPAISISAATTSAAGSMSSADKAKLDAGSFTTLSASNDMEITDATKGVVLKSPNNTRYRLTVSNSGLPIFTALLLMMLAQLASAQNIGMATDTNGTILTDRTNTLTLTNPLTWATNVAATTRTNLGLGWSALTNTNAATSLLGFAANGQVVANTGTNVLTFTNLYTKLRYITLQEASDVSPITLDPSRGSLDIYESNSIIITFDGQNGITANKDINFDTDAIAATTRTNLGLGSLATNNSVPSGAATTNSILQADGAGGSAFVASRTQTVAMTNSAFRTNTTDNSTNNAQAGMVLNLDANSTYHFAYAFIITSSTTGGFGATLRHNNTTNGLRSTYVGRQGRPINISAIDITADSNGVIALQAVNFARTNIVTTGTGILATGSASGTLTLCWHQNTATNVATELGAGSMMTVTKISP